MKNAGRFPSPRLWGRGRVMVCLLGFCLVSGLIGEPWDWARTYGSEPGNQDSLGGSAKYVAIAGLIGLTPSPAIQQPEKVASATPGSPELYQLHCAECHGSKGTGSPVRRRSPEIPDFTDASWQARRTDSQLLDSIIEGKGPEMPPLDDEINDQQAHGLVKFVRAFAPTSGSFGQRQPQELDLAVSSEAIPPVSFIEKLIRWLGNFHSPSVHFPIALLTAAAVAELLRMATGKPSFDAISRFCVWFGTLTALAAGSLGWFKGGLRLTDSTSVMMMHRWLGTSTVVFAMLVLVLSELSRRPDRRGTRMCFRACLLLLAVITSATGFFGGAVVFGLNHYAWPQ